MTPEEFKKMAKHSFRLDHTVPDKRSYQDILQECISIADERELQYGPIEQSIGESSSIANAMFDLCIKPEEIVQVLIALKISRQKNKASDDNMLDLINYTAILFHLQKQQCQPEQKTEEPTQKEN